MNTNYNYKEPFKRTDFLVDDVRSGNINHIHHGGQLATGGGGCGSNSSGYNTIRAGCGRSQSPRLLDAIDNSNATATTAEESAGSQGCFCCDSDEDSIDKMRFQHAKGKCVQKCFRICLLSCLIIGYTFVGAVIFLATEDQTVDILQPQQSASSIATTIDDDNNNKLTPLSSYSSASSSSPNESTVRWLTQLSAENRAKTVQNIWDITVNLNILYRDNWTRLASKELNMFQERLLELLWQEKYLDGPVFGQDTQRIPDNSPTHWKLGKAFLYSISILATIGYGNTMSKSITVKMITMAYTALGLPVMFMYLSSMGSLLSTCAQHIFSRTLCCCLCSKCGYCCYDEKLMEEKEKRMKRKRQLMKQYGGSGGSGAVRQELPFFVGGCSSTSSFVTNNEDVELQQRVLRLEDRQQQQQQQRSSDDNSTITGGVDGVLSADSNSRLNNEYSRFLAPLFVCLSFTFLYVLFGSLVLYQLDDDWTFVDSVYFCFMLVSTIGLGDSVPSSSALSPNAQYNNLYGVLLVWFFSAYIFLGLGLSAMCFNIIHDGVKRKITELYVYSDRKLLHRRRSRSRRCSSSGSRQSTKKSSLCDSRSSLSGKQQQTQQQGGSIVNTDISS